MCKVSPKKKNNRRETCVGGKKIATKERDHVMKTFKKEDTPCIDSHLLKKQEICRSRARRYRDGFWQLLVPCDTV
jgi:hypothetical protein